MLPLPPPQPPQNRAACGNSEAVFMTVDPQLPQAATKVFPPPPPPRQHGFIPPPPPKVIRPVEKVNIATAPAGTLWDHSGHVPVLTHPCAPKVGIPTFRSRLDHLQDAADKAAARASALAAARRSARSIAKNAERASARTAEQTALEQARVAATHQRTASTFAGRPSPRAAKPWQLQLRAQMPDRPPPPMPAPWCTTREDAVRMTTPRYSPRPRIPKQVQRRPQTS